ncbi:MAG: methyltransferase domain-containing protein [Roseomonas sp.]|nr:methyltransferase domain-containing protein [Roseomonas sp.]
MTHRFLTECLCCGSSDLRSVIDLGVQPPANSYSTLPHEEMERFPLGLNRCAFCWHAQLTFCVDRRAIFDHYAYVSGTSATLDRFFFWFSEKLSGCYSAGARVLELAANDGSLLKHLAARHFDVAGMDPARNIVDVAKARGLPITCGYWPDDQDEILGKFDVIICMNVVAHVDDPGSFVSACVGRLNPGGVLIIQPSQARMFENGEFDTIYHEHISFFNTRSMAKLAEKAGLKLYGAAIVAVHGDSPVYFLGLPDSPPPMERLITAFGTGEFGIPENLAAYEQKIGLYEAETYERFERKAQEILHELVTTVEDFRGQGHKIAFVGAAAKALTVINACGVHPDHFLDEAPMKIGKYAPGVGTLIESLDKARSLSKPTLFVITAWNFRKELKRKLLDFGVPAGSVFYSYFPQPELTRAEN